MQGRPALKGNQDGQRSNFRLAYRCSCSRPVFALKEPGMWENMTFRQVSSHPVCITLLLCASSSDEQINDAANQVIPVLRSCSARGLIRRQWRVHNCGHFDDSLRRLTGDTNVSPDCDPEAAEIVSGLGSIDPTAPAPITGIDGKTYPRTYASARRACRSLGMEPIGSIGAESGAGVFMPRARPRFPHRRPARSFGFSAQLGGW